jgi:hypothetical protein
MSTTWMCLADSLSRNRIVSLKRLSWLLPLTLLMTAWWSDMRHRDVQRGDKALPSSKASKKNNQNNNQKTTKKTMLGVRSL